MEISKCRVNHKEKREEKIRGYDRRGEKRTKFHYCTEFHRINNSPLKWSCGIWLLIFLVAIPCHSQQLHHAFIPAPLLLGEITTWWGFLKTSPRVWNPFRCFLDIISGAFIEALHALTTAHWIFVAPIQQDEGMLFTEPQERLHLH